MYRRILVPLDGSTRSERVLPHAIEFARVRNAKLLLLHVIPPSRVLTQAVTPVATLAVPPDTLLPIERRVEVEAKAYLDRLAAELQAKDLECEILVVNGSVVQRIAEVAELRDADLVLLTCCGKTALAAALFGSVAHSVQRRVDCPVLIVRGGPQRRRELVRSMQIDHSCH